MTTDRFDTATRRLGSAMTRRGVLQRVVGAALTVAGGGIFLPAAETAARRKRRKHKNRQRTRRHDICGRHGDGCGALNDLGEYTPPYCCHGYTCVYAPDAGTWTCQTAP
jgi:hypothetical protein